MADMVHHVTYSSALPAIEPDVSGKTLAEVLGPLGSPDLLRRLMLFIGGTLVLDLSAPLPPGSEIHVTPAFIGG